MSLFIPAKRSNAAFKEGFWTDLLSFSKSKAGTNVTAASALEVMAVLGCLRVISEDVAQTPLKMFRKRKDGGSDIETGIALADLLDVGPNDWQTIFEFIENLVIQAALAGNFYGFKNMVRGRITEIIPLQPGSVSEKWSDAGVPSYLVTAANGESREFPASSVWHVRGPSWDTRTGMSAIRQARDAIGLSMATEDAHARLHANGAQPSGMYSVDASLDAKQYEQLSKWVFSQVSGVNRSKPLILDRGAKWTPTAQTGMDSQHLETRNHQILEICRAFRVMPIMIGQADKAATYASAEQMFLAHIKYTLMPWYRRLETSINKNLLTREDRAAGIYAKFLPNALMRGTAKDRSEFYYKMWSMGTLSANEIREMEEQNPYDGGEIYRVQLNTTDASKTPESDQDQANEQPPKPQDAAFFTP